ncbi:hypothetical protein MKX03_037782, partial [Papaver bracteatum]
KEYVLCCLSLQFWISLVNLIKIFSRGIVDVASLSGNMICFLLYDVRLTIFLINYRYLNWTWKNCKLVN